MSSCTHNFKQAFKTFSSCEFDSVDKIITRGAHADLVCGVLKTLRPRKKVAIKAFRQVSPTRDKITIENELGIWRLLCDHPHIASFIGIAPVDSYNPRYLSPGPVSDYYIHGDLNMYLYKVDPAVTDYRMRFKLLIGVIRGLAYIHSQSIVHGDLKAGNVLFDGDLHEARICDFGSARIECGCYSGPKAQAGTMPWESPELWMESHDTESEDEEEEEGEEEEDRIRLRTQKSDIWAFGCVALEVQLGTTPWDPKHEGNLLKMQMRQFKAGAGYPAKKSDIKFDQNFIIEEVWGMMKRCWNADPLLRPGSDVLLSNCEALDKYSTPKK